MLMSREVSNRTKLKGHLYLKIFEVSIWQLIFFLERTQHQLNTSERPVNQVIKFTSFIFHGVQYNYH